MLNFFIVNIIAIFALYVLFTVPFLFCLYHQIKINESQIKINDAVIEHNDLQATINQSIYMSIDDTNVRIQKIIDRVEILEKKLSEETETGECLEDTLDRNGGVIGDE